jgi:hypothetical protein
MKNIPIMIKINPIYCFVCFNLCPSNKNAKLHSKIVDMPSDTKNLIFLDI